MQLLPALVESPRLTLRQWTLADLPALAAAIEANLDHLRPWMAWAADEPSSLEKRRARLQRWRRGWEAGLDSFVGMFDGEGAVVGGAGLHRRVGPGGVEVGYWVHADHLGRGYATEAAGALTGAAFEVPDIERVEIHHDKANVASGRVPARLGFTLVGESPRRAEAPAEMGIECRWEMARQGWPVAVT